MTKETRQLVEERCLQMEKKCTDEIEALAQVIATTVDGLATKEALRNLEEQVEDLRGSK